MNQLSPAIRFGLFLAAASILLSIIPYLLDMKTMSMFFGVISFIISIVFMFLSGTSERDSLGGFITWKQALKTIWICGLIGFGIGTLYQVVFMKYIDPELMEEQKEMQIKMMEGMRGTMGDEATEAQIERIQSEDVMSFKNISMMIGGSAIMAFFIAAILALIVKRDNPNELFDKYGN